MSYLEKLLLGVIGATFIDEIDNLHEQRIHEREQRRLDSLFWQDAARRGSNAFGKDEEDDDRF